MDAAPVTALRAIAMFAGLDEDALAALAGCTTYLEAPAGTVLVEVGQPGAGSFVPEGSLSRLLEEHPKVAVRMLPVLAERLAET